MTYYLDPSFIEYDEWFIASDPKVLWNYKDEKKVSNSIQEFYHLAKNNLIMGSSSKLIELS